MILSATRILRTLLILGLLLVPSAEAQPPGSINVKVTSDSVTLRLQLDLTENLTSLPQFSVSLDRSNSSLASQTVERAMQAVVPGSRVEQLQLQAHTSLVNQSLHLWLMEENYTIVVAGANTSPGSEVRSDLAILSMNVSDPIALDGFEMNRVGSAYLLQPLQNLVPTSTTRYFWNGAAFLNKFNPTIQTTRFSLLDFHWVPPISQWSQDAGPLDQSTVWTLNPPAPYNSTIGLRLFESNTYFPLLVAVIKPSLQVSVPARAWAVGSSVYFDLPTGAEILMPVIIGALLAIGLFGFLLDRNLTRTMRSKRKRR